MSTISNGKVRELRGRKFDVVEQGLDEEQVAEFIDELIQQRDTLLEQINSLLSYIRLSKSMPRKEDKPVSSSGQQTENRAPGTVTEVGRDTQPEVKTSPVGQGIQPEVEATEPEQVMQPLLPDTSKLVEAHKEEPAFYQGELELVILPPVSEAGLLQFERRLRNSFQLKILSTDGSSSKGSLITVQLSEPQPFLQGLKQIPEVKEAAEELDAPAPVKETLSSLFKNKQGKRIWVTLHGQAN